MKRLIVTIKKPYAREVLLDLEKPGAITIVKTQEKIDPEAFWGSWRKRPIEEIDEQIRKMREEWDRPI